jgi:anaerobic selenocysteine-containing dehydrogenase
VFHSCFALETIRHGADAMTILSRRRFLQIGAGAAGAGAAAAFTPGTPAWADFFGPAQPGDRLEAVPTYCDLCFWKCGAIATKKNGHLWKIEGNPADPLSRGRLCPRGTGGVGTYYDTDRLRSPLLRRKNRGEDEWVEVTWDEALESPRSSRSSRPSTGRKRSLSSATASAATSSSTLSRRSARRISSRPPTLSAADRAMSASS